MTPIPEATVEAAEFAMRKDLAQRVFNPGAFVGYVNDRTFSEWTVDALMGSPYVVPLEAARGWPVIDEIAAERRRQIESEGFSPAQDDRYVFGQLARAAMAYAAGFHDPPPDRAPPIWWPWERRWWKPKDRRRDLIRAAALIVAEIERLDRVSALPPAPQGGGR